MLKGRDGLYGEYRLKSHPRLWLDGADGPTTSVVRDPDGPGPQKSRRATGPVWDALNRRLERIRSRASSDVTGGIALLSALGWFMDNQAKLSDGTPLRKVALDQLNKVDEGFVSLGACDKASDYCGWTAIFPNTHISYMGSLLSYWSMAYTLMRSEMTDGERKLFAEKMLNGITKDIGGGCENRLERLPGTFQLTAGGTTATAKGQGTSWNASLENRWIYMKSPELPNDAGVFVLPTKVQGVADMTMDRPSLNNFYNRPLHFYRLKPWASGQCGMGWVANHYANTPDYVTAYGVTKFSAGTGESDLTIQVAATDWIPKFLPFYLTIGPEATKEIMKVTAVSGNRLTVTRGEFSTTPRSWPSGTVVVFSSHTGDGDEMGWNNRTITRQVGHIMTALALADDDPRAVELLRTTVDYWHSNVWFAANNYFTIVNTSTTAYGMSRLLPFLLWSVESMYMSTTPPLDYRGNWIKRAGADFYFHFTTPWNSRSLVNWGIAADNCMTLAGSAEIQCAAPAVFLQSLYPGSPEASYAWNWLEEQGIPEDTGRLVVDSGDRTLVPLLLWGDPSLPRRDHRQTLMPHIVANKTDNPDASETKNLSVVSSKTDWTPQASHLYILAADQSVKEFPNIVLSEKVVDAFNGDYGIGKDGWLLGQNRLGGYWMLYAGQQNVVDFGPVAKLAYRPFADVEIDRKKDGDPKLLYVRLDVKGAYAKAHQVTRGYRSYIHFKKPGQTEHIVVYDDFASSLSQRIRSMLHYGNNGGTGEGDTRLNANASLVSSDNTKARLFTNVVKVSGAGIVTDLNVAWKEKTATVGTYCLTSNPCRVKVGSQTFSYTAPATINALPPSTGKAEVYVWLNPLNGAIHATTNNVAIQCQGAIECGQAATDFPTDVIRLARLGWSNGKVTAACPGGTNSTKGHEFDQCVGGNERHLFMDAGPNSTAGEFLVVHKVGGLGTTADPVVDLTDVDPRFVGVQVGGANPKVAVFAKAGLSHSDTSMLTNHTGVAQYLITGLAEGVYDVERDSQVIAGGVTVQAGDNSIAFESASGRIVARRQGVAAPLWIRTSHLEAATAQEPYTSSLIARGGTDPYLWSVLAGGLAPGVSLTPTPSSTGNGLPPGVTLRPDGILSGTPTSPGSYSFTLAVSDASNQVSVRAFTLPVAEEDKTLRILTTSAGAAVPGDAYSLTLLAAGGSAPYRWAIQSGALPSGLELNAARGEVTGTVTTQGEYTFTVAVIDAAGATVQRTLLLSVSLNDTE